LVSGRCLALKVAVCRCSFCSYPYGHFFEEPTRTGVSPPPRSPGSPLFSRGLCNPPFFFPRVLRIPISLAPCCFCPMRCPPPYLLFPGPPNVSVDPNSLVPVLPDGPFFSLFPSRTKRFLAHLPCPQFWCHPFFPSLCPYLLPPTGEGMPNQTLGIVLSLGVVFFSPMGLVFSPVRFFPGLTFPGQIVPPGWQVLKRCPFAFLIKAPFWPPFARLLAPFPPPFVISTVHAFLTCRSHCSTSFFLAIVP